MGDEMKDYKLKKKNLKKQKKYIVKNAKKEYKLSKKELKKEYKIVSTIETDPKNGKVSNETVFLFEETEQFDKDLNELLKETKTNLLEDL